MTLNTLIGRVLKLIASKHKYVCDTIKLQKNPKIIVTNVIIQ